MDSNDYKYSEIVFKIIINTYLTDLDVSSKTVKNKIILNKG